MRSSLVFISEIGEAEARRQKEIHAQRRRKERAKNWEQCKTHIFTSIRRGLTLLFMMAVVTFAFSHQEELQKLISSKLNQIMAPRSNSSSTLIRQNALNHEKEVDQMAQ
jgi:hypothetical protein